MQFLLSSPLSIFLFLSSDISLSGHNFLSTHCFNRRSHIMFSRTPILSYPEQISMEDNENCNCSTPCEEVHYLSSLSSTVLASTFVVKQLINSSIIKKKASIRYDRRDFSVSDLVFHVCHVRSYTAELARAKFTEAGPARVSCFDECFRYHCRKTLSDRLLYCIK